MRKEKRVKSKILLGFLLTTLCYLMLGCPEPFMPSESGNPWRAGGKGSFSLSIKSIDSARTILPATPVDFALYELIFTPNPNGVAKNEDITPTGAPAQVLLDPGTYKLDVNAYKDTGKTQLMARGSSVNNIVITAGANVNGSVTLKAIIGGGQGDFTYNVTLPTDIAMATMAIDRLDASGSVVTPVNLFSGLNTDKRTLNAGYYDVTFNLEKTDGKKLVWRELLHIYVNMESVYTQIFTEAHFSVTAYTVKFMDGGNELSPGYTLYNIPHGSTIERPTNDPEKAGYAFTGWYTTDGGSTPFNFNTKKITSNTNVYAGFESISITEYLIYTLADLRKVGTDTDGWTLDKNYKLMNDITITGNWTPIGDYSDRFTGSFDGNGKSIINLTINEPYGYFQGMFGAIDTGGVVKNLALINCNISGADYVGGVAGGNAGTIENCYTTGVVKGDNRVGGVVGGNEGTVKSCFSSGSISGNIAGWNAEVGGVAGGNAGTVENCYATGNVSGNDSVGGVAGGNSGILRNCYATGIVSGDYYVGGVVGSNEYNSQYDSSGRVENCVGLNKNIINIGTSGYFGRVAGYNSETLTNNYGRTDMKYNNADRTWDNDASDYDGANITETNWISPTWWSNTALFNLNSSGAWEFPATGKTLPILRSIPASVQNPKAHIFITMVLIPAGTFQMGSPTNEPNRANDETQHSVTLTSGFYMGKYEVTQAQYEMVMGSNPSGFKVGGSAAPYLGGITDTTNFPVEWVSWYDALVFCNKLSMLEGLSPAYRISGSTDPAAWGNVPTSSNNTWNAVAIVAGSNGYRLPTEAQWEYACRAGTTTAYNTGATINNNTTGWYGNEKGNGGNSGRRTHQVGEMPANAWGLYDMHGNVGEWCWDWYRTYAAGAQTDPQGAAPTNQGTVVSRGGDYWNLGEKMRSAYRTDDFGPYFREDNYGFRIIRPL
jgi:uncharacterized repeat protein (TIGR02543 family)